jgi:hypothetical protein
MTPLVATRLCAEAMRLTVVKPRGYRGVWLGTSNRDAKPYDPINDDVDVLPLVKAFKLDILYIGDCWRVICVTEPMKDVRYEHKNLNRAIVYCVAISHDAAVCLQKEKQ